MPAPSRLWLIWLIVGALALGAAGWATWGAPSRAGEGPRDLPSLRRPADEGPEQDAETERRRQVFQGRVVAKYNAVKGLLQGQLTLGQTAARFRAIDRDLPVTWGPARPADGPAENERLCRQVIARAVDWVEKNLPEAAAQVAERLEAELRSLRGPDGAVHLPHG